MQILNKLLAVLSGISLQIFVATIIFFAVSTATISMAYGLLVPPCADAVARVAVSDLDGKIPSNHQALRLMSKFNLAWCYMTNDKHQPLDDFKHLAPYLPNYADKSRKLTYRGENYYEAVLPMGSEALHLGFSLENADAGLKDKLSKEPLAMLLLPMRLGALGNACLVMALGLSAWITLIIGVPLSILSKTLSNLVKANEVNLKAYEKQARPLLMVAELNQLEGAVKGLFIYLATMEKQNQEAVRDASARAAKWLKPKNSEENLEQTLRSSRSGSLAELAAERSNSQNNQGDNFGALLKSKSSSVNYAEELCSQISGQFADKVLGVILLKPEAGSERWLFVAQKGLSPAQMQALNSMDLSAITGPLSTASKINNLGPLSLKRSGLDIFLQDLGASSVIAAPIRHKNRNLAAALLLASSSFSPENIQSLDRLSQLSSAIYHGLLLSEEAREKIWLDALTGLKNKAFINELVSALGAEQPYFFCHIAVEARENLSNSQLEVLAQEAARVIQAAVRDYQNRYPQIISDFVLGRMQKAEYALIIKSDSSDLVGQLAANILKLLCQFVRPETIEAVGIGIATAQDSLEDIVMKARLAALYAQEESGGNKVCRATNVPTDFKPRRKASVMQGELGVLDAADLVQSLLVGQSSGILTVDDAGRHMQMTLAAGRILSANVGPLSGFEAIIEFFSTFENGSFNFQETQVALLAQAPQNIPPITPCLMEAALAQDYLAWARKTLTDLNSPVIANKDNSLWETLLKGEELPERQQSLLTHIINKADGSANLEQILRELEQVPTAYKWRAAALLINYGLLSQKRF